MVMSPAHTAEAGGMMSDINTTPLIDVMLVLLIMFILTIPLQTQAVKMDLPKPGPDTLIVQPLKNEVTIDPQDRIYWNGTKIDLEALRGLLFRSQRMSPPPELHIHPDRQARYETVDKVLAVAKRLNVTRMGFVGNEQYANF